MVRDDLDALLMVRELLLTAKPPRHIRNTFSNVVRSQLSKVSNHSTHALQMDATVHHLHCEPFHIHTTSEICPTEKICTSFC